MKMTKEKSCQIRQLRNKTGCGLYDCRKAIEFCEEHTDCLPEAYLRVKCLGVLWKMPFLDAVKRESLYLNENGTQK